MLDVRLARLGLPLPLEPAIGRALMHRERAAQHEGLVLAWELAVRILAGSLWAACRHANATSTALERVTSKLDRPSMGHWVELARTCASLLRETNHPAAAAFRATLDGLESPLPAECGLRTLCTRIAELPDAPPRPRRVQEALDQIPHYRNSAQSTHKDVGPAFREASVQPLLEGLIDFCERVPLLGAFSLVLVGRLESRGRGGRAELARLHGTFPSWTHREIPESVWPSLVSSRPYLFLEPDLAVPLFPMAAVTNSGAEWHVGWYARQVHVPTVAYQGAGGHEFQIVLAPDELDSFVRGSKSDREAAPNSAALALEPFRGLLAYDEEHAAIFFGREEETEAATAKIEERGALFVFGASGSGKSSWLRAGIVPALRARAALAGRKLLPIVLMPGDHPLSNLRRALTLARGGTPDEAATWARTVDEALPPRICAAHERGLAHLLRGLAAQGTVPTLVVDQMEEASMLALDKDEGRAFLALVATAAASAKDVGAVVLASARADLLAPLLEHESVRRFLEDHGAPVGSIPPERLARVIVEPLRGRNVPLEAGLAETILADVADEPGSLALLSQVLTTLWSERARFGGGLTKQGYIDAGRVSGALEKQAEAALAEARDASRAPGVSSAPSGPSSPSETEKRVDRLFRALAASDEGERFTRRRVKLGALASELGTTPDGIRALAQPFLTRRLVVLAVQGNEETIEVAHERLLVAWPRLANLLTSERELLELRAEIEVASAAWQASGGRRELWSDSTSKLRRGEELLSAERLDLDQRGRDFLNASRRSVSRRKRAELSLMIAVMLLAIAAGYGMWSARQAADRETVARIQAVALAYDAQMRGLISSLEYFDSLDDDVYTYARRQDRSASEWWIASARELLDGVQEDPATGRAWEPGLRLVDIHLVNLRKSARERTPAEVERDRQTHPRWNEYEAARDELQWRRRMLGEEPWPDEREIETGLAGEKLPTGAAELNELAWRLVCAEPDQILYGREVRGLLLARRAVAAAPDTDRAGIRDTLAWALYRCGRFDEALVEGWLAVEEAQGDLKEQIVASLEKLHESKRLWEEAASRTTQAERTSQLAARLAELEPLLQERRTWTFKDNADDWWHKGLVRLQDGRRRVEQQLAFAEASVHEASAVKAWQEAIEAIARSEHYRGVKWPSGDRLTPQLGLVPIGPDPDSGLWEFAHLATGRPAQRDGSSKRIQLDPEMGLVLVLLPGGLVPVANSEDQGQDRSLTEVDLDPFFLSKYEMTQAQWERIGGFRRGGGERTPTLLPASELGWDDCQAVLPRVGWIRLSTEVQWEYGCRGGTTTKWWPGDDVEELRGVANIRFSKEDRTSTRAIGELRPNPFGLHDVHGNKQEWCGDAYADAARRAGDGLLEVPDAADRAFRGGASWGGAEYARSSFQSGNTRAIRFDANGLRPARGITP